MKSVATKDDHTEGEVRLPTKMALGLEELTFSPFASKTRQCGQLRIKTTPSL